MTKREEYKLKFKKIVDCGYVYYDCIHEGTNMQFLYFANILRSCSTIVSSEIILNIEIAQNEEVFEGFFSLDSLGDNDNIIIQPPNVLLDNGKWSIPMNDFKELLEEWRDFLQKNEKKSFFRKLKF